MVRISLKGPYLPTVGGVSIHIARLSEKLFEEGILGHVYNTLPTSKEHHYPSYIKKAYYPLLRYDILQSLYWLIINGVKDTSRIFHIHGHPIWESPTVFLSLMLKKRIVFTIHDQMILDNIEKYPKLLVYLFNYLLHNQNIIWIAVNQKIKDQIHIVNPKCGGIFVIPGYLPGRSDLQLLDNEIEGFIKNKTHIISLYAHSARFLNEKDLYGIDLAIKALGKLTNRYPNIGLIVIIPGEIQSNRLENYMNLIKEFNLESNILFFLRGVNNPLNLWRRSNIVLRPTLTDGDSLVVREAIAEGTLVISSDVVERPAGTILFRSENVDDLADKIITALKQGNCNNQDTNQSYYTMIKELCYKF